MIRSLTKARHEHAASPYRNAGGNDRLVSDLGDLVTLYVLESVKWPRSRGAEIIRQSEQIDAIRIRLARNQIRLTDATIWLDAGYTILNRTISERLNRTTSERRR